MVGACRYRLLSTKPVTVRGLNYVPSAWHLVLHEPFDFEGAILYVEARRGRHVTVMMWPLHAGEHGCCITRNAQMLLFKLTTRTSQRVRYNSFHTGLPKRFSG